MIRRLIATMMLLTVAAILVSPCADLDAMHHHQHHHHFGLSVNGEGGRTTSLGDNYEGAADHQRIDASAGPATSAMRC